jgi:predicted dehydrogenase
MLDHFSEGWIMRHSSRRQFLINAAAGTSALAVPMRRVLGANDSVNLGFIGVGSRGTFSTKWFSQVPGVRIGAVCDADEQHLSACHDQVPQAKKIKDLRQVLEDKTIDAVVISTCNHWHALAAVWACQAGKDVYVEKPLAQTIWEGRKIVEAARKYGRIVQGGTQQRSDPVQPKLHELIKSGKLGRMQWIRGVRYGLRESIGKQSTPLKPPGSVNYDLWLGPAQDLPMYRTQFHYDWHWFWNTGSGELGNWGVHVLDDIRNMLFDKCTLPKRILAGGARLVWNDAGETPNVHFVYYDTGIVPVIFALTNLPSKTGVRAEPHYRGIRSGFVIQFENGYYAGGRGGGSTYDNNGKRIEQFEGDGGELHARNFVEAVRKRDTKTLNAPVEETHYSSAWCHLANIGFRLGVPGGRERALEAAKTFKPWSELLDDFYAHVEANGVDPAKAGIQVSSMLEIDPGKETFTGPGDPSKAKALLTREYRKSYQFPTAV